MVKKVFSKRECERHISGDFHIHDLDNLCPYCIGWDTFTILQDKDKSQLQLCKHQIDEYVKGLKLSLNQKTQIGLLSDGIDFLGFNHKLSSTGKIIKSLRGSAKNRQRKYLKAIRHYYLNDVLDDEYIDVRLALFRGHLKGTKIGYISATA